MDKRALSTLLALYMLLSLLPGTVLAADPPTGSGHTAYDLQSGDQIKDIEVTDDKVVITLDPEDNVDFTLSGPGTGASGIWAYWAGVGIEAPQNARKLYFVRENGTDATQNELDQFGNGHEGFAIWINAGNKSFVNSGVTYKITWKDQTGRPIGEQKTYVIKLAKKPALAALPTPDIREATLSDVEERVNPLYKAGTYRARGQWVTDGTEPVGNYIKVTIEAEQLEEHMAGDRDKTMGHWVGFHVDAPAGAEKVYVKAGKRASDVVLNKLEETNDNDKEVDIYFSVNTGTKDITNSWVVIQWQAGGKVISTTYYHVTFTGTLASEATSGEKPGESSPGGTPGEASPGGTPGEVSPGGTPGEVSPGEKPDASAGYTVTFNPNGGTVSPTSAKTGADGKLSSLPTPTRSGYTFDGWYTKTDGGDKVSTGTVFTGDTTVYAHWKQSTSTDAGGYYAINISSGILHGTVSSSHSTARAGTSVTITVNPDIYYSVSWVEVTRAEGQLLPLSQSGNQYTFTMPAASVTVNVGFSSSTYIPPQSSTTTPTTPSTTVPEPTYRPITTRSTAAMPDVPSSNWAYAAAQWAYQNGYLDLAADGSFSPKGSVNHLHMWKLMSNWLGGSATDNASVSAWANQSGAARFGNATDAMTRQDFVLYLYQVYFLMGGKVSESGSLIRFRDGQTILSGSTKNAWIWAVGKGLIEGTASGYLNPDRVLTRSEFASVLMRLCRK